MTPSILLASVVRDSRDLFVRYLKGFDDTNALAVAPHLPNHLLWTLGHLAITQYRGAAKIDGGPVPASLFIDGPVGDSLRFGTESVAFGSRPKDDPSIYPPLERATEIFNDSVERLAGCVERAAGEALEKPVAWGAAMIPARQLVSRLAFHNGTHCGQIVDLRRALGMPSIFGS